ncbi:MAG: hypothetical protein BWK80_04165 [Desulfobacteraceae bacterium IS3]|nr:MAG: hypothetical protein BWK80_04165 [Desulfobacteraceae bacterium IS3]
MNYFELFSELMTALTRGDKTGMKITQFILLLTAGIILNFNGFNAAQAATDCAVQTDIPQAECEALVAFYNATDGPNWSDSPGNRWNQDNSPGSWDGLTVAGGNVLMIGREGKNLKGTIPSLTALPGLLFLYLNDNQLTGSIPDLSALTDLQDVNLSNNRLSGNIPASLSSLVNMARLRLSDNLLEGSIPDLTRLTKLWHLDFSNNQMSGQMPELNTLKDLKEVHLNNNQLTGAIPDLSKLTILEKLNLNDNKLSGQIPAALNTLTTLVELNLFNNQLSGEIPDLSALTGLPKLNLSNNQLTGSIPANLSTLTALTELDLSANQLTGNIPSLNPALQRLELADNQLTGTLPASLNTLTNLWRLNLQNNQLSGNIPVLNSLTDLADLWLSGNKLEGVIPDLTALEDLRSLNLSDNRLSGDIPSSLSTLSSLGNIDVGYNRLTASDQQLIDFLNKKSPKWANTQTVPPENLKAAPLSMTSAELSWSLIRYTGDGGYYRIKYATTSGGPYTDAGTTDNKMATDYEITELSPGTYYFVVETFTPAHNNQQSDLTSELSEELEFEFTGMPEISVKKSDDTEIPLKGKYDFGTALLGTPISVTFTIENTGNADLILTEPISLPEGFTLSKSFGTTTVSPSASTTFEIQLDDALGTFEGTLSFANNDSDENPYAFTISGTVKPKPEPEIALSCDNSDVPDGGSFTFGESIIATSVTKSFKISNTGTAALTVDLTHPTPEGFSLVGAFPETIAVGESAEFQLRLTAAAVGTFKGEFQFDTNDSDENPYQFTLSGTVKPEPEPEIAVSTDSINIPDGGSFDFGEAVIGTPITKSFTITNTGTAALTLNLIHPIPNGFSQIGAFPNTVAAGGSGSFQLQFDAKTVGAFEGIIQFDTNDKDENPYNFTIKGKANPEPEPEIAVFDGSTEIVNNGNIDFGSTLIAVPVNKIFTVKNTGTDVLNLSHLVLPTGFILVGAFPDSIAAGETGSFQIQLNAVAEGAFSGALEFETNDKDENPCKFTLRGTVNAEAVPEIEISVSSTDIPNNGSVSFGTTVVGKPIVKTFTIRNIGTAALTVGFTLPTPDGFSMVGVFPDTIAAGDSGSFQIRLDAAIDGTFSGIFEFDTNDEDENPYRFTLTGTVNIVTEPEIEVWEDSVEIPDAGKLNFGVTDVGNPVVKSITIKNTGTAILELSKLNVPEGFSLVGAFPKTITVGSSDSFRIRLDADTDGKFIGTLRFVTNDLNENPYNFTLRGIVNPEPEPEIEVWESNIVIPDSGSISFGNTVIGGSAIVKSFTIKNTGTAELTLDSLTLPKGFSLTGNFPDRISTGTEDIFQIRFYADQVGVFEGTLWFNTNDSDENPYNFTVKGAVNPEPEPEIEVFDTTVGIPDSGTVNFGSTIFGLPIIKAFTVRNTGTAILTLGDLELPEGFEQVGDFPDTVPAGQSYRFQVRLNADKIGVFEGTLRFETDDDNENPYNFTVKGTVNPEPEPEIAVWDDGTEIPNNDTVSLGTTTVGVPAAKTFTIRNTGMAYLNLSDPELPEGFSLVGTFSTDIASGGTDEFQIRLNAAAVGTYSGIFRFYTNDRDESPYSITISGAVNPQQEAEIEVSDNGKDIPDGGTDDFGTTVAGIPLTKTFTIRNTGSGLLKLSNLEMPDGFSLTDTFPETVTAKGTDSFQIRLDASVIGIYDGILRFVSNDSNENPYDIRIYASVVAEAAPEIVVSDNGTDIPNRGTFSFNSTTIARPVTKTFTVRNTGTSVLTLSDLRVPEGFALIDTFPERIATDGTDSFQIRFSAATIGDFEGILRFVTNDKDENPYEFTLKGKVLPKPEPEIEVIENDIMIPNQGSVSFGSTTIETPVTKTFTIRNIGTAMLEISGLVLPDSCSLISTFPNTVAAGSTDSFQIRFNADTVGAFEGLIELGTNDSDESRFYVTFFATVLPEPRPEIELWENNLSIPISGNVDFGKTLAGMPVIKTFTLKNTGDIALELGAVGLPAGFDLIGAFPHSVASGGADHFQIRLTAATSGVFTGSFQFDTNDADENPYKLIVKGVVNAAPTIIGQYPITMPEDTQLSDIMNYLTVSDPDNVFPDDFGLTVREGKNYTLSPLVADIHNTTSVVSGDIDKDGDIDLITGNDGAPSRLYLNNGTADPFRGAFGMDIASDSYHTRSLVLGDIDGDGDLDLIAGNEGGGNRLYLNNAAGNLFKDLVGINVNITTDNYRTQSLALGDIDGDGDLDLIAGNDAAPNRLYINNGSPNPFRDMQGKDITTDSHYTRSIVLGDIDGDGDLDLIVGNDGEPNRLYLNNGTDDPFKGIVGMNISGDSYSTRVLALSDVDSDADLDLIVGNDSESNRLYLNNGTGNPFDRVTGKEITTDSRHTRSLVLGDIDGDGDSDLIVGNEGELSRLYLNNGTDDPFDRVTGTIITNSEHTASLMLTDADSDGDLDLIAGNTDSPNRLYLNNGTQNPFRDVICADIGMSGDNTIGNSIIPLPDFNGQLVVPVTVNDGMMSSNLFYLDVRVEAVNDPPVITGQNPLTTKQKAFATTEGTALTFSLMDLTVADPDNRYPEDFTLKLRKGENYTVADATITPALGFIGMLTVPVEVHDGTMSSNLFDLEVIVKPKETPKNEPPVITGQKSLTTPVETSLTITLNDLTVTDPDNRYPDDFTLTIMKGDNYEISGNAVNPASGFSGTLKIPVTVSDGTDESHTFYLTVTVRFDSDGDGMPDNWELKFGLDPVVNDADGDSDQDGYSNLEEYLYGSDPTDSHSVPQIPISHAGEDQIAEEGNTVALDGSASTSPNRITAYSWIQTEGIPVTLSDTSNPKPNFVTPCADAYGSVLTFELTITDGKDFQASDEVNITVKDNGITEFPADVLSFITATGNHAGIRVIEGGNIVGLYTIHPDNIPETKDKPNSLLYGLIEIHIKVADKGGNAVAVVYLPTPAPNDCRWYQYDSANGWSDLGSSAVFNDRRDQITLTLTDGGTGDSDGLANGFITGIYGLGSPPASAETSDDGSGGCFIATAAYSGSYFGGIGFIAFIFILALIIALPLCRRPR